MSERDIQKDRKTYHMWINDEIDEGTFKVFATQIIPGYITAYEAEKTAREKAEADYDVAKAAVEFFEGEIKELRGKVQHYTSRGLITDLE